MLCAFNISYSLRFLVQRILPRARYYDYPRDVVLNDIHCLLSGSSSNGGGGIWGGSDRIKYEEKNLKRSTRGSCSQWKTVIIIFFNVHILYTFKLFFLFPSHWYFFSAIKQRHPIMTIWKVVRNRYLSRIKYWKGLCYSGGDGKHEACGSKTAAVATGFVQYS